MIENIKQYQVTKDRLAAFQQELKEVQTDTTKEYILKKIEEDSLKSWIIQFEEDIKEWEKHNQ